MMTSLAMMRTVTCVVHLCGTPATCWCYLRSPLAASARLRIPTELVRVVSVGGDGVQLPHPVRDTICTVNF